MENYAITALKTMTFIGERYDKYQIGKSVAWFPMIACLEGGAASLAFMLLLVLGMKIASLPFAVLAVLLVNGAHHVQAMGRAMGRSGSFIMPLLVVLKCALFFELQIQLETFAAYMSLLLTPMAGKLSIAACVLIKNEYKSGFLRPSLCAGVSSFLICVFMGIEAAIPCAAVILVGMACSIAKPENAVGVANEMGETLFLVSSFLFL